MESMTRASLNGYAEVKQDGTNRVWAWAKPSPLPKTAWAGATPVPPPYALTSYWASPPAPAYFIMFGRMKSMLGRSLNRAFDLHLPTLSTLNHMLRPA